MRRERIACNSNSFGSSDNTFTFLWILRPLLITPLIIIAAAAVASEGFFLPNEYHCCCYHQRAAAAASVVVRTATTTTDFILTATPRSDNNRNNKNGSGCSAIELSHHHDEKIKTAAKRRQHATTTTTTTTRTIDDAVVATRSNTTRDRIVNTVIANQQQEQSFRVAAPSFPEKQQQTSTKKKEAAAEPTKKKPTTTADAAAVADLSDRRFALEKMMICSTTTTTTMALSSLSPPVAGGATTTTTTTVATASSSTGESAATGVDDVVVVVPLEYVPALNAFVVHYYLFGERFGAIVDTGSPFLTAPSTCSKWSYKYLWGCYQPELTSDSGYADTFVALDNNLGTVAWRKAEFSFFGEKKETEEATPSTPPQELIFGVFGPDMLDGPGGVFLGLIKETDKRIYPSFLGQTGYDSFCVDLRQQQPQPQQQQQSGDDKAGGNDRGPRLVLSKRPMIREDDDDYIPLTNDLNRKYGASVVHYAAKAASFAVNGVPILPTTTKKQRRQSAVYVIFDTGCSGMSVPEELLAERYTNARKNKEKSLWGNVTVSFETKGGTVKELTAIKPLTTPLDKATLSKYKDSVIVLGLAFLNGIATTIDVRERKLKFVK